MDKPVPGGAGINDISTPKLFPTMGAKEMMTPWGETTTPRDGTPVDPRCSFEPRVSFVSQVLFVVVVLLHRGTVHGTRG